MMKCSESNPTSMPFISMSNNTLPTNVRELTNRKKEAKFRALPVNRVFGPRPRDYRFKLNKKVKLLARKSALSAKAAEGSIVVVEDFNFEAPKTKEFVNFTKNLKFEGSKILVVLASQNKNVYLSARNIERANIITANELNTYKVLDNKSLVLTESSVAVINEL